MRNSSDDYLTAPLLEMCGIRKSFPGVLAISSASFELIAGEIHALVGENGAGKSTLIKILTGVHHADAGEIRLNGRPIRYDSPLEARRAGIATIYQELTLVPALSVRDNLFLGQEKGRFGFPDARAERKAALQVLERLGVKVDPATRVADLSIARQQLIEIARALLADCRILVMDEPTAALTPQEVANLFALLRELTGRGIGVIFISHRLDEVFAIADRITIMRDGATIDTQKTGDLTRRRLIEQMVGRTLEEEFPKVKSDCGAVGFEVRDMRGGPVDNISFSVKHGEVLGIAGLMGAGRTEMARLIFGADPKQGGTILIDGVPAVIQNPRDAIRHGICLLTEDRKLQGLILKATARENFSLPNVSRWSHLGFIKQPLERMRFSERTRELNIRLSGPEQRAEDLSGGNQQKLLVARWLETDSQVVIFDEPTRGIDVGAKYEMYLLINSLAAQGKMVIVISSELPEILGISDRIVVMREGRIAGEIADVSRATQEEIMALAV